MRTYRRTVVTDLEPREVWEYLADFAATDEWDPRARHGRLVEGDAGVGSRYETDVHFLGRTTRMAYTVTRLEAPQWIEWVGENRMVRAHDVIEYYVTAFLQAELRADPAAMAELSHGEAPDTGVDLRTRGY